MTRRGILAGLMAAALLALGAAEAPAAERVKVVTSFSLLADLVRQIGAERVAVVSLVGPNADTHVFQPTPAAAKELMGAHLVVVNGLGFDGWAERLARASGFEGALVIASQGIETLAAHDEKHGDKRPHGRADPHAWQDVVNAKIYVAHIRAALIAVDPAGRPHYEARADAYRALLDVVDAEIRAGFAPIPRAQRRVITSHDAFNYFGRAYGIDFLAPQGVGANAEPTAKGVASLIRQIKRAGVKAVFIENISNPRVIERIAKETGVRLGGTLYSDALSEADGPAATYVAMMRHNARALAEAMK